MEGRVPQKKFMLHRSDTFTAVFMKFTNQSVLYPIPLPNLVSMLALIFDPIEVLGLNLGV